MSDLESVDGQFESEAFTASVSLDSHLAWESFMALARCPSERFIVDCNFQRREMNRGFLLVLAWGLSRKLKTWTTQKRVGIVLPPGIGASVANLAVVLADKVPVNLNFTLGAGVVTSSLDRAEVDCILSASVLRSRLVGFPWPSSGMVDVVDALRDLPKLRTFAMLAAIRLLPAKFLATMLRVPRHGGQAEAGLLFTSGSSGDPKGVVLTHRNILANCQQIDAVGLLPPGERVLANLPLFHSFGFTVTFWYPLLRHCSMVALGSPLEYKKAADVIEQESVSVLVGTPTFLKPYLKRVSPDKLVSLKCVVAGAEKTPDGFADQWEARLGCAYLEGYGLTETSPVVSVNMPEARRAGSVGRLLPGQSVRILDPDTRQPLDGHVSGLLALRGPNVFAGYLNDAEQTAEVKDGEWFITGDLVRLDEDGYLYIEGRLSRFSKIGGEMVPHGTIEEALARAYGVVDAEQPIFAVSSREDPAKGEALVLLSAMPLELAEVRAKLVAAGLSNLWIPKEIVPVESIPMLATGKLDLLAIKRLAERG